MIRSFVAAALALSLTVVPPAMAGTPQEAQQFIDGVASKVLGVIKTDQTQAQKLKVLEGIFTDAVDIPYVGKYVLGRHWRTASATQQKDYLAAYQPFVIKNYAGKLTKYSGQKYRLKNARGEDGTYNVTMEIIDPGSASVFVDYTLREEGKAYKVVDIAVEGVSLRATQRSEFNSIVNSKGLDYLISALQKQAARKA